MMEYQFIAICRSECLNVFLSFEMLFRLWHFHYIVVLSDAIAIHSRMELIRDEDDEKENENHEHKITPKYTSNIRTYTF